MSLHLHPVRRTMRLLFWPMSRPLAAALLWSHRHTIGLWARSYKTEITSQYEGSFSPARMRLLTTALWRVSSDPKFRNDPTVRRLTIDTELTEVNRDERIASLEEALADLPGVVSAEVGPEASTTPGVDVTADAVRATVTNRTSVTDTAVTDRIITPSR